MVAPEDIMLGFVNWLRHGEYTPFGKAFDQGSICSEAIRCFEKTRDWRHCGSGDEWSNGNGGLMRILPVCLHYIERRMNGETVTDEEAIAGIHDVTALTHSHLRSRIASGLYFFMACEIVLGEGDLRERLQRGIDNGFSFYSRDTGNLTQLAYFGRLRDLNSFMQTHEDQIKSTGYVVATLEAAVWCLLNTDSFRDCLIKAVNLGNDADTVGAVAGGLAGLFFGYDQIHMTRSRKSGYRRFRDVTGSRRCAHRMRIRDDLERRGRPLLIFPLSVRYDESVRVDRIR